MSNRIANKIITILCDDIRQEVGNKESLMGVYEEDLIFDELPALLQRLSIFVYLYKIKEDIFSAEIIFTQPGDKKKKIPIELQNTKAGSNIKLELTLGHMMFESDGPAKFEIILNNDKKKKVVHDFNIQLTDKKTPSK